MFATWRWTVCSLRTSDDAISRFDSPAATRRSTSASRRLRGDAPFEAVAGGVVEEAGERALEVALVVEPWQVRVAAQRDEPRVREQRGELAAVPDRHRPVAAPVEHERRHRDAREVRPRIGRQLELEERRGGLGVRSAPEMAPDRGDLVAARMRDEEP